MTTFSDGAVVLISSMFSFCLLLLVDIVTLLLFALPLLAGCEVLSKYHGGEIDVRLSLRWTEYALNWPALLAKLVELELTVQLLPVLMIDQ